MKRTCIQCGKEFELSNSEIGFYKKRKLSLPKRCRECREQNKKGNKPGQKAGQKTGQKSADKARHDIPARAGHTVQNGRADDAKAVSAAPQHAENRQSSVSSAAKKGSITLKKIVAAAVVLVAAAAYAAVTGRLPFDSEVQQTSGQNGRQEVIDYTFRNEDLFWEHYEKHGIEMGFESAEAYLEAANLVIDNPEVLHKVEAEDGDDIYFLEDTNEFVVVSTDGYIRTYFEPEDGMDYYERQ